VISQQGSNGETLWDFEARWERLTADVQKLSQAEQQHMVEEFEKVLDGQHKVVRLQEPVRKEKRVGRPRLNVSQKRKREERAEKSTQRDPSAFEWVEAELTAQRKKRHKEAKKKEEGQDKWCLRCMTYGHLRKNCPKRGVKPRPSKRQPRDQQDTVALPTLYELSDSDEDLPSITEELEQVSIMSFLEYIETSVVDNHLLCSVLSEEGQGKRTGCFRGYQPC